MVFWYVTIYEMTIYVEIPDVHMHKYKFIISMCMGVTVLNTDRHCDMVFCLLYVYLVDKA